MNVDFPDGGNAKMCGWVHFQDIPFVKKKTFNYCGSKRVRRVPTYQVYVRLFPIPNRVNLEMLPLHGILIPAYAPSLSLVPMLPITPPSCHPSRVFSKATAVPSQRQGFLETNQNVVKSDIARARWDQREILLAPLPRTVRPCNPGKASIAGYRRVWRRQSISAERGVCKEDEAV